MQAGSLSWTLSQASVCKRVATLKVGSQSPLCCTQHAPGAAMPPGPSGTDVIPSAASAAVPIRVHGPACSKTRQDGFHNILHAFVRHADASTTLSLHVHGMLTVSCWQHAVRIVRLDSCLALICICLQSTGCWRHNTGFWHCSPTSLARSRRRFLPGVEGYHLTPKP